MWSQVVFLWHKQEIVTYRNSNPNEWKNSIENKKDHFFCVTSSCEDSVAQWKTNSLGLKAKWTSFISDVQIDFCIIRFIFHSSHALGTRMFILLASPSLNPHLAEQRNKVHQWWRSECCNTYPSFWRTLWFIVTETFCQMNSFTYHISSVHAAEDENTLTILHQHHCRCIWIRADAHHLVSTWRQSAFTFASSYSLAHKFCENMPHRG